VTTLKKGEIRGEGLEVHGKELLSGQPASPGIGSGEVKIILDLKDLDKIKKGDVLVTKMTNPDMVVTMQKCAGIVTEEGGATCHAAIVSREMGIPAVVGTGNATSVLKDKMMVTVDGFKGKVYEGVTDHVEVEIKKVVDTKTKIKVTVDLPTFAERSAKTGCKAVGLVRIEGIIAESGMHPYGFIKEKRVSDYEDIIYAGINKIGKHFDELWIRTSDVRSDEYRHLRGAPEDVELNPMLGMHGVRAGLKYPEILKAELRAASKLAEKRKVGIMMPQIISASEVRAVKKLIHELKIDNLILGVMVETPAASMIIEELCKEGIKFISFGTNDLTQFTLALDRGNETVQYLYDEMHLGVLRQLSMVIDTCKKYGVESSICGQAGSKRDMVEFLVKHGIDSISVNADKAYEISVFVKELEDNGLRGSESGEERQKACEKCAVIPSNNSAVSVKESIEAKPEQEEYAADFSVNVFEQQTGGKAEIVKPAAEEPKQEIKQEIQKIIEPVVIVSELELPKINVEQVKEMIKEEAKPAVEEKVIEAEAPVVRGAEKMDKMEEATVEEKAEEPKEEVKLDEKKLEDGRLEGVVKFFKLKGNYGFITASDGKDYFAHRPEVKDNADLIQGEKVSFKLEESEKGTKAVQITKLN
jgi:phosphoenolpyruvate-protein kinase (PTS system EI component)/cold shock CspA family protein